MDDAVIDMNGADRPFQIGLVLAGAISAGAYTAGVLDFLLQSLHAWEKERGTANAPSHRVVIKVVAGASAGAITGALGAVALARGLCPREFSEDYLDGCYPDRYEAHQRYECVLPSLYSTWVELPAMVSSRGTSDLLGTDDITSGASGEKPMLRSLLNAKLLDEIKRSAIEVSEGAEGSIKAPVPFIATRLHLYLTISNMRGIPFKVAFGRNSYGMQTIGDRIHYVVTDLGSCDLSDMTSWVEKDAIAASLPISVTTLPKGRGQSLGEWDLFGTSALASGAFPMGLASRRLSFPWAHYQQRRYPIPLPPEVEIRPDFPVETESLEAFTFESIDGGLVNNNPFDYAQYALAGGPTLGPVRGQDVDRAIIMVAPFPDAPEFLPEGSPAPTLTAILRALFPALVNQARFRASELAPAMDERDFSRFLVAPLRRLPRSKEQANTAVPPALERYSIACGLLGGFGGFFNEKFRAHDFQLGRRNCQQFLRDSLHLPHDNKIVSRPGVTATQPLIPLVGDAADPIPLPCWPQMSDSEFQLLSSRMEARIDAVVPVMLRAQTPSIKLRSALRVGWRLFLRSRTIKFVRGVMLADLVRRGQMEKWDAPASLNSILLKFQRSQDDVNAIAAELINPAFDFRTSKGIAIKAHLSEEFVSEILVALANEEPSSLLRVWKDDNGYTLFCRRPGFIKRLRLVRWFNRWWNAPAVN